MILNSVEVIHTFSDVPENELCTGCVLSKELAELLEIPVQNDGRNLHCIDSASSVRLVFHTQDHERCESQLVKLAIDEESGGLKMWLCHDVLNAFRHDLRIA
jgi:hypothetical protein